MIAALSMCRPKARMWSGFRILRMLFSRTIWKSQTVEHNGEPGFRPFSRPPRFCCIQLRFLDMLSSRPLMW